MRLKMRFALFLMFFSVSVLGQERAPFLEFDPANKAQYLQQKRAIEQSKGTSLEKINLRIRLASRYKAQGDLITALENKIITQGENAQLRYLLGGANGIKALQVNKMFSIPYVNAMLENFQQALILDFDHLPALEAYVEALCMVPSLLGGDKAKARQYAMQLKKLDPVQGFFALGFIAASHQQKEQAREDYKSAFLLLEKQSFCVQRWADYFAKSSMNFAYKIAEISTTYQLSPEIGLCAINYFIDQYSPYNNLPLEWAYFQKAQLLYAVGETAAASNVLKESLEINPTFEAAKKWQQNLL